MNDESFKALCDRLERLKGEKSEAAGSKAQLLRQLEEQYGVKTVKEAKALAAKIGARVESLLAAEDAELARLKKKYPEQMKGMT